MVVPQEIAPGLWHRAAPHPGWRAGAFGREVGSYALRMRDGDLLLVDPLLPAGVPDALDALVGAAGHVHVYVTIPCHVRDAAPAVARWGARRVTAWSERRLGVFYAERFVPTPAPLLELPVERVLVTHGAPVLRGGGSAPAAAVAAERWYDHG